MSITAEIVTGFRLPRVAGRLVRPLLRVGRGRRQGASWWPNTRGVVAMEFALVSVPFLTFMLFICEFTYGMFTQEILDGALHRAVAQMRGGYSSTPPANAASFITQFLCPQFYGLLECSPSRVFMNVTPVAQGADFYSVFPYGALPVSGNTLNLASYQGAAAYCTPAPQQFYEVSAIYIGPTFVGYLLPNILSVQTASGNGLPPVVHATLSTVGFAAENFPLQSGGAATCPTPN